MHIWDFHLFYILLKYFTGELTIPNLVASPTIFPKLRPCKRNINHHTECMVINVEIQDPKYLVFILKGSPFGGMGYKKVFFCAGAGDLNLKPLCSYELLHSHCVRSNTRLFCNSGATKSQLNRLSGFSLKSLV